MTLPAAAVAVLACPVCGQGLAVDGAGLRCPAGHAFDRARQGHVTLLPPGGSPHEGDTATMVGDRADFLAAGHYAGITAALADAAQSGVRDQHALQQVVRRTIGRWVNQALRRRPMIVPMVIEA